MVVWWGGALPRRVVGQGGGLEVGRPVRGARAHAIAPGPSDAHPTLAAVPILLAFQPFSAVI